MHIRAFTNMQSRQRQLKNATTKLPLRSRKLIYYKCHVKQDKLDKHWKSFRVMIEKTN